MDQKEVINNEFYNSLGDRWYTSQDDPVALLRAETEVKGPWVIEKIRNTFGIDKILKILDVGCGGGFLSNRLAQERYDVTGIDLSQESLNIAKNYDRTGSVKYLYADAYQLPFLESSFDVVTAMDFLEHVDSPGRVIQEISRVLKPGGLFFFHTFNRNFLSGLVIIKLVELLVKNTPPNMHVLRLFIKPAELSEFCMQSGMSVHQIIGIRPRFSTITAKGLLTRTVPKEFKFTLTNSKLLSYMGYSVKTLKNQA